LIPNRIEWTRDNIAGFGGDPSQITLWGQSAGAASVDMYSYAYPSEPIISSMICDSGAATILISNDYAHSNFIFLAGLVGCGELNTDAELACMRAVPAQTLENALSNYVISKATPSISFAPIADNRTVFSNNTDRAERGLVAKIVSSFPSSQPFNPR
jgi:carboxylesterase type B